MAQEKMLKLWAVALGLGLLAPIVQAAQTGKSGEQIYAQMCVKCHGAKGEGVAEKYDEALVGDRSVQSLAKLIAKTMPEDAPKTCVGADAEKVAAYIYDAFYSPAARAKLQPARIDLARLTVGQYRNAVADLFASFGDAPPQALKTGGLAGQYYASRNFKNKPAISRTDPRIEFVFENATPDAKAIPGAEFSTRWRGSVIAEETGEYEFVLKTENGARLWVNDEARPLIDAWVSSSRDSGEPREHRQVIFLLGGRAYPLKLDVFRYKDKTASIALKWKPPHGALMTIPERNLSAQRVPETLVVSTPFPADDSSVGYERGTSVSKQWDQATTNAAIDVAQKVIAQLDSLSGSKAGASDREDKVKAFCARLAERAFRRPLSAQERAFFVDRPSKDAGDIESGVKRAVVLVLKSPRFLYPGIDDEKNSDYAVATRLALGLWDSIPDQPLLQAASQGKLRSAEQVAAQTRRMLDDPRARAKVRGFLHEWLETEEAEDLSKDVATFPDFNEMVLADLRTSLDLFLDEVVWSESSDYRQLLLADYLLLNERLAKFYGVEVKGGEGFEKVSFDPRQRCGVLTHPFLLSALAYHKSSSPIHRGVFLTRNIVGRTLRPPPMAIEFMDDRFDPSLTMREKVTELTRPAGCQSCHATINPLGFSLEHYDAVGRFRTVDNSKPVDARGELPIADGKSIRISGARDVAEFAASSPDAHRAFIRQLFNYVVKQPVDAYGADTLEKLRASFVASEYNIQALLVEIARVSAMR